MNRMRKAKRRTMTCMQAFAKIEEEKERRLNQMRSKKKTLEEGISKHKFEQANPKQGKETMT